MRASPARRALLFLLRAIWWWVKSFFSVGLGGARFRAPLDLPVLIPRVKNGLPRGTRAAFRERQSPQLPTKAVAARGGCVCAPCRPSAVVSATRGESRRRSSTLAAAFGGALRAVHMPTKSAAVSVLTSSPETPPRFSCPRNPLSVGLTLALSCGRGLTRPVSRQFAPAGRGGALPRIDGGAGRGEAEAVSSIVTWKDNSRNCLALARRLAPPTGSPRCGSATLASLGAFRPRFKQLVKKVGPKRRRRRRCGRPQRAGLQGERSATKRSS